MYWQISSSQDEPSLQWWLQQWNQKTVASWQESYDKPRQCVEKQRHFSADKGLYSHGCGPPSGHVWLSELDHKEGRVPKSIAFELQWWWRLLKVPWTARRSNQSILREIYPEYLLEGLMLNLKVYYIGHLMWIDDWLEKSLMLHMIEGRRGWQNEMTGWASPMQWTWTWANFRRWWGTVRYGVLQSMGLQIQLGKWTTTISWDKAVPGRVEEEKGCEDNGNTKLSPTDGGSG